MFNIVIVMIKNKIYSVIFGRLVDFLSFLYKGDSVCFLAHQTVYGCVHLSETFSVTRTLLQTPFSCASF